MIRGLRDFRLLPLVLVATAALLGVKSLGLLFDGGYIFGPPAREQMQSAPALDANDAGGDVVGSIGVPSKTEPAVPDEPAVTAPLMPAATPDLTPQNRQSWAQEMFSFPDVTGSIGGGDEKKKPAAAPPAARNEGAAAPPVRTAARNLASNPTGAPPQHHVSASERAILERLQERRKELEARARELDMRESLLKAAESRLVGRVKELKQAEGGIKGAPEKKDEVATERFQGLVSMYENMKAKDAARIFDRLELKVLADLAGKINPRRMADILANMSPEAAERLTVEFATNGGARKAASPQDLPKIEGRPIPPK